MKRLLILLLVLLSSLCVFAALDFSSSDELWNKGTDFQKVYDDLKGMLSKASGDQEKAAVYWRLARVCVDLGDALDKKQSKEKIAIYTEGEDWGQKSIDTHATKESYQWHCSCIGRYGQTKGVLSSLVKVDPMLSDLRKIFDDLKVVDYSEAWYVMAVLFNSVPSKSNTEAISYARVSAETIPADKLFLGTYKELAEQLYSRNWSASKRASEISKIQKNWDKSGQVNSDKYKYYEGKDGASGKVKWMNSTLSEVSDREEARAILNYALNLYKNATVLTPNDDKNYSEIKELLASW